MAQVTDPLFVVTGVGTQRLGKSTLLNLFHSRITAGFGLGHTLDAEESAVSENIRSFFSPENTLLPLLQTTGLWIWLRRHTEDPVYFDFNPTLTSTTVAEPYLAECRILPLDTDSIITEGNFSSSESSKFEWIKLCFRDLTARIFRLARLLSSFQPSFSIKRKIRSTDTIRESCANLGILLSHYVLQLCDRTGSLILYSLYEQRD